MVIDAETTVKGHSTVWKFYKDSVLEKCDYIFGNQVINWRLTFYCREI